jgi:hypothetical protein
MAQNVIYLEIQYGKLVSLGMVDPSTLQWSGPPRDIATSFFNINFDTRKFELDEIYFNDGQVLIGIQFFTSSGVVKTKMIGNFIAKNTYPFADTLESSPYYKYLPDNIAKEMIVKNNTAGIYSVTNSDPFPHNFVYAFDK